jgi:AraC family transcriptional regulator
MTFVDCQFEIRPEVSLRSENVLVFVGITPDAPNPNTVTCPGHYLMTMSITPRVQGGRSRLWDGGELSANVMGDLMLIPPGYSLHSVFQDQAEERKDAFCLFPQDKFEDLMGGPIKWTEKTLYASTDVRDINIDFAMRRLMREAYEPGMASSVFMDSIATTLAVDIRRYFSRNEKPVERDRYRLSERQLKAIRDFVIANSAQDLRLSELAKVCGLSVRHMMRAFRNTTGTTVARHVADVRVELAKQMLRDKDTPTKVIASRVGFANVSSFSSAFHRLTGVSPGSYRKGGA